MYTPTAALRAARSQVAYHEGQNKDGHWNNIEKYCLMLPGFSWAQGQPWCAIFAQWALWMTGVTVPPGAQSAGCAISVAAYKKAGRFSEYPGIGFQVFYGPNGGTHTGLVWDYDNEYIYTIEGNTNSDGSSEGDGVYEKKRLRKVDYVYGYGIPYYYGAAKSADPKWNGKELRK